MKAYGSGAGNGAAANKRSAISFGSEHGATDPSQDTYLINSLVFGNAWFALNTDDYLNVGTIERVVIAYNTLAAMDSPAGGTSYLWEFKDTAATADHIRARNNNIILDSSGGANDYWNTGAKFDFDYNNYYRRGGSTTIYKVSGTNCTLSDWQASSGTCGADEDDNSALQNPLVTTDSDTAFDATLQVGSPLIDAGTTGAYTVPTWLPTALKDYLGTEGIRGTTLASGVEDDYASNPDIGYHYDYPDLTNTDVEPASLVASASGNLTVSFTIPDPMGWFPYNGSFELTLPSGFTYNSGGTTAVSSSSVTGSWDACTVNGQTLTCGRSGDGSSEFPGSYTVTISNIGNPSSAGSTGSYGFQVLDSSDSIVIADDSILADNITSGGGGGGGGGGVDVPAHFSCSGPMSGKGFTFK
jgi:hypothetical protein